MDHSINCFFGRVLSVRQKPGESLSPELGVVVGLFLVSGLGFYILGVVRGTVRVKYVLGLELSFRVRVDERLNN